MTVKEKIVDDVAVVTVSGKLMGGSETKEVHEKVKSLIAGGIKKVVIDMSKVKWLNSVGIGSIMACYTSLLKAGGDLRLSGITKKVKNIFMITQVITIFKDYDTVEEAVSSFKEG